MERAFQQVHSIFVEMRGAQYLIQHRLNGKADTDEHCERRPEKKRLAGYSGMTGAGGAGRESPIGDDDNEEVRQRAAR